MSILLRLFLEYFKIGLFSVGGGLATMPFLQELSAKTGWFTLNQLADMIAVSESTPGPLGVNCATYVGFETAGILGGLVAVLGLVAPSIIVILIVAAILEKFRSNRFVNAAFYGLRAASTGLIASAGVSLILMVFHQKGQNLLSSINWLGIGLALVLLYLTRWCKKTKKLHPIIFIGLSAVVGIVLGM